ncbi:hypothetical protein G9A89_003923 [Geosiphon pyriformis]|nr:hypothetical protein G9A89_003923 [Geosiphon pyriformis]
MPFSRYRFVGRSLRALDISKHPRRDGIDVSHPSDSLHRVALIQHPGSFFVSLPVFCALLALTASILSPSNTLGRMIKEILSIDKNLSYGRQLELYGQLGEIIEDMKLMKKTTSEIQVEILGII